MVSLSTFKRCAKCGAKKPDTSFYRTAAGNPRKHCKACDTRTAVENRRKNGRGSQYNATWRTRHPNRYHAIKLAKYGLTVEDYNSMLDSQGGVCAICGGVSRDRRLSVDHCHETGRVRGLLCIKCNSAIGFLGSSELLDSAKRYLSNDF